MFLLIGSPIFSFAAIVPAKAAVATAHPLATSAAATILQQGGNAFDAAVAAAAALGVVEPQGSGFGGGGFWLLQKNNGETTFVDGREKAPSAASRDMYVRDGTVDRRLPLDGALAAGIPGLPAALVHIQQQYGKLDLPQTLAPAIALAHKGFKIDAKLARTIAYRWPVLTKYPVSREIFGSAGQPKGEGDVLRQGYLANTIERIAKLGNAGFYEGPVAQSMVRAVRAEGGVWTMRDLLNYKVVEREPIKVNFQGMDIWSAPPPSSGGIALATIMNQLRALDAPLQLPKTADDYHRIVEVMRRAYYDRATYLGDPDFVAVPVAKLTSQKHARTLAATITHLATVQKDRANPPKGQDTTHYSIVDKDGNIVSATLSINYGLGSGFVAGSSGVLLNDEMDDFSAQPGVPNVYGLVGGEANSIAPGKRPLSSMTPTIASGARGTAVLGTPGGSRIITMVLLGLAAMFSDKPVEEWVRTPRFHHQYLPNVVQHEPGALPQTIRDDLIKRGHVLKDVGRSYGNMHALWIDAKGNVSAASDPRGVGQAVVLP